MSEEEKGQSRGWKRVRRAVARRFRIDTRTLAIFRVSLGVLLLADLLLRARNLVVFYTDRGVLPTEALAELYPGYRYLSVHALSGSVGFQIVLFALAAIAAVALILGYRTRIATVVSVLLFVSLQARNPMVLDAGDPLLRRLLFWSVFLPLGAHWSVDARHSDGQQHSVTSVASAGLLLQVVLVYLATLGFKLQGEAWLAGRAVREVFQLDTFTILFGEFLTGVPPLLVAFDLLWLALIAASPLLLLFTGHLRSLLAAAFLAMHIGMALTMQLGLFPVFSMVALVPFFASILGDVSLPSVIERTLDTLARRLPTGPRFALPGPWDETGRTIVSSFLIGALLVFLALNAIALGVVSAPAGTPDAVTDRSWDMFSPAPPQSAARLVAPATLESGRTIDALARGPLRGMGPPDTISNYPTARWHKYATNLREASPTARRELAGHLCSRWNRSHADEMVRVRIGALIEEIRREGPDPTRRVEYEEYDCSAV